MRWLMLPLVLLAGSSMAGPLDPYRFSVTGPGALGSFTTGAVLAERDFAPVAAELTVGTLDGYANSILAVQTFTFEYNVGADGRFVPTLYYDFNFNGAMGAFDTTGICEVADQVRPNLAVARDCMGEADVGTGQTDGLYAVKGHRVRPADRTRVRLRRSRCDLAPRCLARSRRQRLQPRADLCRPEPRAGRPRADDDHAPVCLRPRRGAWCVRVRTASLAAAVRCARVAAAPALCLGLSSARNRHSRWPQPRHTARGSAAPRRRRPAAAACRDLRCWNSDP